MFSLDDIRVASPCKSDWNQMFGDDRRRFCAECKLNVYNLAGMTREDAERLVMSSEGRLCVRFFRRKDGTVLTQNCPVGWKAVKQRISRVGVALTSVFASFLAGVVSVRSVESAISAMPMGDVESPYVESQVPTPIVEEIDDMVEWEGRVYLGKMVPEQKALVGRDVYLQQIESGK